MKLSGWGNYPVIDATLQKVSANVDILNSISLAKEKSQSMIARGLGRSYGDSALSSHVISTKNLDRFIHFDETSGLLTCQAGVSIANIIEIFVPKGWFLRVTPGTQFVTVGGAIASDVHGKNHHIDGCFSQHVTALKIATVFQGIVECSREKNATLFFATCGGMGLTGVILEATFKLMPIESAYIEQTTLKAKNLEEALSLFDDNEKSLYSVAWIDCLARGEQLGRSLIMLGKHAKQGGLILKPKKTLSLPCHMPSFLLNQTSVSLFNALYYHRVRYFESKQWVDYQSFFYPLDSIHNWDRLYGKAGFCQYQLVLPKKTALEGLTGILKYLHQSKRGSFLAVLKLFGKANENYLSFPFEGYTLALDFKMDKGLLPFLEALDSIVLAYEGRLYLTKDARMSKLMFETSYPQLDKFKDIRKIYGADHLFNSEQSKRLGL